MNWNHYPQHTHKQVIPLYWRQDNIDFQTLTGSVLPHGNGKSYGDVCLNADNNLLATNALNRFIAFDTKNGLLTCEAGTLLSDILTVIVPAGWFLPVLPGTQFVTMGGAIANDIHGKNHLTAGTFGKHVRELELLKSNGKRYICSLEKNPELYKATIGGLGLTGIILSATIQLKPICNAMLNVSTTPFYSLDEYLKFNFNKSQQFEYTMAWFDPYHERGHYFAAQHCTADQPEAIRHTKHFSIPLYGHPLVFNSLTISLFNQLYFKKSLKKAGTILQHYKDFFFPLDKILNWNHVYGRCGFLQYQCVLPNEASAIKEFFATVKAANKKSSLVVIKSFGNHLSPGILSFPKPGLTIAMDFANPNTKTLQFLSQLDNLILKYQGRINPSKDARMSGAAFKQFYPNWTEFAAFIDPQFSSSFWRRVT